MAQFDTAAEDRPSSAQNAVGDHATARDSLGFAPYVEAVCAFLTSQQTSPPLTMSIEGEWGSGKSSFLLQLEARITGPSRRDVFWSNAPRSWGGEKHDGSLLTAIRMAWQVRQPPVIRFNAWRHDKQDALWAAFALAVSRRLRQRIGFWRGLGADARLFFLRLKGVRGWLELLLAAVSIFVLLFSIWTLRHDLLLGPKHLIDRLKPVGNEGVKLPSVYAALLMSGAAAHGSWLALMLVALAGLVKFWDQIKLPIAFDLKKYLSTPDYKGHSAFIESFHEDFGRLVRAYTRDERIFIFIDDLDRCDVPRAAELMQAINLMISDAGNLVFILGMDREKVAAGLTQKYKDLLPYLPEYAPAAGGNPVAFGYSYLEKFIQLTFTLPVMAGEGALEQFLNALVPVPGRPPWRKAVNAYWQPRLRRAWKWVPQTWERLMHGAVCTVATLGEPETINTSTEDQRYEAAETFRAATRVARLRLRFEQDSASVHDVVRMVSPLFGHNPRRLKQFLSTYRLALALTYRQGILASVSHEAGVTMQQLGKFVALTMKFPDLRGALMGDPGLLGALETAALEWPGAVTPEHSYWRWLQSRTVRSLLTDRVPVSRQTIYDISQGGREDQFSLVRLDVSRLMSLLPKVASEPEVPEEVSPVAAAPASGTSAADPSPVPSPQPVPAAQSAAVDPARGSETSSVSEESGRGVASSPPKREAARPRSSAGSGESKRRFPELFLGFAKEYERIRRDMEFSEERTVAMTRLMNRVQAETREFGADGSEEMRRVLLAQNTDGARIVALGIASVRVSEGNVEWLLDFLEKYRSRFEHYWAIRTLSLHSRFLTGETARKAVYLLENITNMASDGDRRKEVVLLLERLGALSETKKPSEEVDVFMA